MSPPEGRAHWSMLFSIALMRCWIRSCQVCSRSRRVKSSANQIANPKFRMRPAFWRKALSRRRMPAGSIVRGGSPLGG